MIPNNIALDWNQIAGYIGSPLIPPASVIATILDPLWLFSGLLCQLFTIPTLGTPNTCQSHLLDRLIGSNKLIMCQKLSTIKLYHSMKRNTKVLPLFYPPPLPFLMGYHLPPF